MYLPVVAKDKAGRPHRLVFRNVRLVPDFKYTLLSVRQLWAEQRIDARFADVNALVKIKNPSLLLQLKKASLS